ncbi:MAG: sulfatase-like hydrolase/transferase [Saprospiraceae bacterium]|nr:sulfatase-like hydrolase/transferase [Saprospiraceae bacterium]
MNKRSRWFRDDVKVIKKALVLVSLVIAIMAIGCTEEQQAEKPNILLIITDQHPLSCVGAYGNPVIQTPNLDKLAASGHLLENFYIAAFACSPSRASILTGRYLHHHNVFSNNVLLDPSIPVMGNILKDEGYETGYFGKAHLSGNMYVGRSVYAGTDYMHPPGSPKDAIGDDIKDYWYFERRETAKGWIPEKLSGGLGEDSSQMGFDVWQGGWRQYKDWLIENGRTDFAYYAGNHDVIQSAEEGNHMYSLLGEDLHMATFFTDETTGFIRRNTEANKPWAAVLSYFGPHLPVAPPQPWDTMYRLDQIELPQNLYDYLEGKPTTQKLTNLQYVLGQWDESQYKDYIRRYWGYSSFIDQQIGRVFELLESSGQWGNTIIVFTTDHGDMVGSHGMIYKLGSNAYEELFHVPAIIRIPSLHHTGSRIEGLTSSIDLLPTLLDAAKINIPSGVDGKSLVPMLSGKSREHRDKVFAEIHPMGADKIIMCRQGSIKYVYHWSSEEPDELYDLQHDPGELHNLIHRSEYDSISMAMRRQIIEWARSTNHRYAKAITSKANGE